MGWTEAQQKAISAREGKFLISAGAGSGKTAVLSERAMQLIKEGHCKIDELLVLTFANDAAAVMKTRILGKLTQKENAEDEACLAAARAIDSACIMTFDALANRLVQDFGYLLGVPSGFTVDSCEMLKLEAHRILEGYSETLCHKEQREYIDLIYRYCLKNAGPIRDLVYRIYEQSRLSPDPEAWLDNTVDQTYTREYFMDCAEKARQQVLETLYAADLPDEIKAMIEGSESDKSTALGSVFGWIDDLIEAYEISLEAGNGAFVSYKKPRLKSVKDLSSEEKDTLKAYWDPFMEGIKSACKEAIQISDSEDALKEFLDDKGHIEILVSMAKELSKDLREISRQAGLYTYNDIFHLALRLLDEPEVKKHFAGKFKFAMVDEYQDTSDLQQAFLDKLGLENVFCVGDVKQSIYGFRHANPKLFASLSKDYSQGEGGTLIRLEENFRSREAVLDGINHIFDGQMTEDLGGVDYQKGEALKFGNTSYSDSDSAEKYGVSLIGVNGLSSDSKFPEARYVANDIARKLNAGYKVYDRDAKLLRPCKPGDFAILLSTRKRYKDFISELENLKIPYVADLGRAISDSDVLMCLCRLVDYYVKIGTGEDKEALKHDYVSVRRSFLYMDSDEEIYKAIKSGEYLSGEFAKEALADREKVVGASIPEAIRFLIEKHDFRNGFLKAKNTKRQLTILYSVLDIAECLERLGKDVSYFGKLPRHLKVYKNELEAGDVNMSADCVKLYTVHKSKGLEFPIVYVADLEHGFNITDLRDPFLANRDYGIAVPPMRKDCMHPPMAAYRIAHKKELVSEQVRLFYVALTRAEQNLNLVLDVTPPVEGETKRKKKKRKPGRGINSFYDFLSLSRRNPDSEVFLDDASLEAYKQGHREEATIDFKFYSHAPLSKEVKAKRASKETLFGDEGAMEYGNLLHSYMQMVKFNEPSDLSFIKDSKAHERIKVVLELPPFALGGNVRAYKEYAYLDANGREGVIDLLLVGQFEARVIDYKSSDITDPAYQEQVKRYCEYVSAAFALPTKGYLVSLSKGEYLPV